MKQFRYSLVYDMESVDDIIEAKFCGNFISHPALDFPHLAPDNYPETCCSMKSLAWERARCSRYGEWARKFIQSDEIVHNPEILREFWIKQICTSNIPPE